MVVTDAPFLMLVALLRGFSASWDLSSGEDVIPLSKIASCLLGCCGCQFLPSCHAVSLIVRLMERCEPDSDAAAILRIGVASFFDSVMYCRQDISWVGCVGGGNRELFGVSLEEALPQEVAGRLSLALLKMTLRHPGEPDDAVHDRVTSIMSILSKVGDCAGVLGVNESLVQLLQSVLSYDDRMKASLPVLGMDVLPLVHSTLQRATGEGKSNSWYGLELVLALSAGSSSCVQEVVKLMCAWAQHGGVSVVEASQSPFESAEELNEKLCCRPLLFPVRGTPCLLIPDLSCTILEQSDFGMRETCAVLSPILGDALRTSAVALRSSGNGMSNGNISIPVFLPVCIKPLVDGHCGVPGYLTPMYQCVGTSGEVLGVSIPTKFVPPVSAAPCGMFLSDSSLVPILRELIDDTRRLPSLPGEGDSLSCGGTVGGECVRYVCHIGPSSLLRLCVPGVVCYAPVVHCICATDRFMSGTFAGRSGAARARDQPPCLWCCQHRLASAILCLCWVVGSNRSGSRRVYVAETTPSRGYDPCAPACSPSRSRVLVLYRISSPCVCLAVTCVCRCFVLGDGLFWGTNAAVCTSIG